MSGTNRYTCEEIFRRLDEYIDRELTPEETQRVKEHLENCARCTEEYQFDRTMLLRIREKLNRIEAPPGLLESIRRRIAEAADPPGN